MTERCCDPPCKKCGQRGNFDGYNTGFLAGVQWAAYETYLPNVDAALSRDEHSELSSFGYAYCAKCKQDWPCSTVRDRAGDSCGGSTAANTLTVSDSPPTPTAPSTGQLKPIERWESRCERGTTSSDGD